MDFIKIKKLLKEKLLKKFKISITYFFLLIFFIVLFLFCVTAQQSKIVLGDSKVAFFTDGVIIPSYVQKGKINTILIFKKEINKIFLDKVELDLIENGNFKLSFFTIALNSKKTSITLNIVKNNGSVSFNIPIKENNTAIKSLIILNNQKKTIVSTKNKDIREKETKFFNELLSKKSPLRYFTLPFENPLEFMKVISAFGNSRIYKDKKGNTLYTSIHLGVDLKASENTRVFATSSGKVSFAGYSLTRGNCIYLDHGFGLYTSYFHLNKVFVNEGQIVFAGEIIGLSGSTGVSTGPHLHFGAVLLGFSIDPLSLIEEMNELEENFKIIKNLKFK